MTRPETTAKDTLRGDILAMGDDFVSMADVQGQIDRGQLADSPAECQRLVVDTIRSLLLDGLIEVGVIPSPSSPGFKPWPGTMDEVMTRFTDRFVGHYDDRNQWAYKIWLNLTAKGRRVEAALTGELELRDLSAEGGALFNAEIAVAIEEDLAKSNYGATLAERGVPSVFLDDNGQIVEHRPDKS
jgi:hypothetical protein